MKLISICQFLFAIGFTFLVSGLPALYAATCMPIDWFKSTMSTTLDLKTDKTYNQSVLIYKGGNPPWNIKLVSGSLPPGLTLKVVPFTGGYALGGYSGDIYLIGQPTVEGDYSAQVQLTDSCPNGVQSKTASLLLKPRCGQFKFIDGITLPQAVLGKPYSFQFKTTCDPKYKWQGFNANQSTVPQGLSISDSGLLSGTATKLGTYNVGVSAIAYGTNAQNTGTKLFPLQVVDNISPTLTFFDITNRFISYQGGKTDIIIKASDNGLLRLPQITVTSPEGAQWRYIAGLKSGTNSNGEFLATVTLPANNQNTDVVYKLNGIVQDTSGNTITSPTRFITVSKIPIKIQPQTKNSQGVDMNRQPAVQKPVQRFPAR